MGTYLDNAATSYPKPNVVINTISNFMKNIGATAGRGAYKSAITADRLIFDCRNNICKLFNGKDPSKVIFTYNITDSLNILINGILNPGDHVITSSLEHNSVWRPLKTLQRDKNIQISQVPCTSKGITNPKDVEKLIRENTKFIVFTHASNVLGTIQPIREIGALAKKHNIIFLVDSAQTAGAYPIDVQKDNIDILAFTGHKSLFGPTGTGGFLLNCDTNIRPLKSGGTGEDSKNPYQPDFYPNKFEAGTLNVAGIVGLGEGIKYISNLGVENIRAKEDEVIEYALKRLEEIPKICIYGPKDPQKIVGVISFNIKGISGEEIAFKLDQEYDIMIRVGFHCAPTAHRIMGTYEIGAMRIGIGYFNTKKDIDILTDALKNIVKSYKL
ncbi:aminotransferase class V-fold PLP-dependent enzyme [Clostridium sp. MT-14]|uniref:cysteine desulfurase n=1 Tax=Clostridium aromativorans TaxID=2836848 RepID=A0ABS8NA11_9CLOT|nr:MULTISPECIES: aminotransferase class V-fold PLP-dependent enzyme [Clostridium]KAA8670507.1 aminotransferase class V-fold PLP-dependent enzyme [Clostridium sp. HV4-5-A1G]MCC9296637.1 aminotransferase class V-fold PLP-dependent enzyme [Clostridium aromativorans]